ncbi:MAG: hypothetical protein WCQ53_03030 [bacterium]
MNIFLYVCTAIMFIIFQASFLNYFLPSYLSPDLISVFVIYVAMTKSFREGVLFTLFATYMLSLNTSVGFLNLSLFYIISFAVARYVSLNFYTNELKYLFLSIALPILASKLFILFWLKLGNIIVFAEHFLYMLSETLITAAAGIIIFKLFNLIDIKTGQINLESIVEE